MPPLREWEIGLSETASIVQDTFKLTLTDDPCKDDSMIMSPSYCHLQHLTLTQCQQSVCPVALLKTDNT